MTEHRGGRQSAEMPPGQAPRAVDPFMARTVDAALKYQAHRAVRHVGRLRKEEPHLSPAAILKKLERKFRRDTFRIGRDAGAAAVSEGVGRTEAIDTITGKMTLESAVFFVFAATEALEIPLSELEDREDVVRAVLLAENSNKAIRRLASRMAPHMARKCVAKIPSSSLKPLNDFFGYRFVTKRGQTGDIVLEDVAASGVGSAIGIATNALFAQNVIRVTRRTLERMRIASDGEVEIIELHTDGVDGIADEKMPGAERD